MALQDDIVSRTIGTALGGRRAIIEDSDDEECVPPYSEHQFQLPRSVRLLCCMAGIELVPSTNTRHGCVRSGADDDDGGVWSDDD